VLGWVAGATTLFLNLIGISHADGLPTPSTIYFSLSVGPGILAMYVVGVFLRQRRLKKRGEIPQYLGKIAQIWKTWPRSGKVLLLCGLSLGPIVLWGSTNIDLGVVLDNAPRLLWVHAPTTVNVGDTFNVTVEAWDAYERVSALYTGTVSFMLQSYNLTDSTPLSSVHAKLPEAYTFTGQSLPSEWAYTIQDGKDNGMHVFTVHIDTPGIHYLLVNDTVTGNTYWSNPIIVNTTLSPDSQIYWGDMHSHSQLSDGSGTPDHHYYYARYVACLDYCALTDHGELLMTEPGGAEESERATNAAYVPGQFVAFQGEEWTQTKDGHKTCIFSGDQLPKNPLLSYFLVPTPTDLWKVLDAFTNTTGCQALAIPHHSTKAEYIEDWTWTNPKYEKFAEVTSVHGECLFEQRDAQCLRPVGDAPANYTPGTCVMDALKMGYRLTCAADSDEHDGHPGHSLAHTGAYIGVQEPWTIWPNRLDMPYTGGITAVHADNLTRSAVFSSLEKAQIYASSDIGRPYLDFTINGTDVSYNAKVFVPTSTTTRAITVILAQDGAPGAGMRPQAASVTENWVPDWNASVQIFKNGVVLASIPVNAPLANITLLDSAPITGTSYGIGNCVLINGKYYINSFSDNPIDPATLNTGGADFYLVRVVGHNQRTAYAGPIWVAVSP